VFQHRRQTFERIHRFLLVGPLKAVMAMPAGPPAFHLSANRRHACALPIFFNQPPTVTWLGVQETPVVARDPSECREFPHQHPPLEIGVGAYHEKAQSLFVQSVIPPVFVVIVLLILLVIVFVPFLQFVPGVAPSVFGSKLNQSREAVECSAGFPKRETHTTK